MENGSCDLEWVRFFQNSIRYGDCEFGDNKTINGVTVIDDANNIRVLVIDWISRGNDQIIVIRIIVDNRFS